MGNARVSFGRNAQSQAIELTDVNDYYPFGMNHLKTGNAFFGKGTYKNYKYNGKELQETGMYDYGARFYMPDIGRWGVVDPLAEKSRRFSPYTYTFNNPINFIDPDGKEGEDWFNNSMGQMEFRDDVKSQQDLTDKGINGTYVGETSQQGSLNYASDGTIYDDSAGGKPIADGRVHNVGEVVITPKSVIAKRNLEASRSRMGQAINNYWGRYAIGLTAGYSFGVFSGSLTLAYNLGSGKTRLFGTYGQKNGTPSYGLGFQFNSMYAFGQLKNGQKFTDVFGGMEGESRAVSAAYMLGVEYSESSKNGFGVDYGTATTSVNMGIGYDFGVSTTETTNLNEAWFKENAKVQYNPQLN